MATDEVIPHVGIRVYGGEMLRLGMSSEEATWVLGNIRDVTVDYRGDPPVVAFIQSSKHWGTFEGVELFEEAADEVVARLVERLGLDPADYPPGQNSYYFPDQRMSLWRSCVSDEDGEQGYIFDCVSLHAPGYYDPKTLAFILRKSGLADEAEG